MGYGLITSRPRLNIAGRQSPAANTQWFIAYSPQPIAFNSLTKEPPRGINMHMMLRPLSLTADTRSCACRCACMVNLTPRENF